MLKGLLSFTKLLYQLYSHDDCRCIEEYHEITLEGESEEDLLQCHADYIDYHMTDLPTNPKFETIGVEIINHRFVIL